MNGKSRPSFLKRQKEQRRRLRADRKREAKLARKQARTDSTADADSPKPAIIDVEETSSS